MFKSFVKKLTEPEVSNNDLVIPNHVAIIMDGNRRWAKEKNLPVIEGHRNGVNALKKTVRAASELGIKYLTVWAFSTENWKRPEKEVSGLISLIKIIFKRDFDELHKNDVCIRVIGDRSKFDKDVIESIEHAENKTKKNQGITLIIALNYGFKYDMTNAVRLLAKEVEEQKIKPYDINQDLISSKLTSADFPNPDLLIRTSGEIRISNFMMWEISYSELYFSNIYWPDFNKNELTKAIEAFSKRERRFGGN